MRHGGVTLSKLAVSGTGTVEGAVGINVDLGAVVFVDGPLAIDGWSTGLSARNNGLVFSEGPHAIEITQCLTGVDVSVDGAVTANNVHINDADVGVTASFKGVFGGIGLNIVGHGAVDGGKASIAIRAADHGVIGVGGATFSGGAAHLLLSGGARAFVNNSTSTGASTAAVIADTGSSLSGVDFSITSTLAVSVLAKDLGQITLSRAANSAAAGVVGRAENNGSLVLPSTGGSLCTTFRGGICTGPPGAP